jgi:hypothetical protein
MATMAGLILALAGQTLAQPNEADRARLAERIRYLDGQIERLQAEYIQAMADYNGFAAMAAPFHNLNPAQAYRLYGSPFPQISLSSRVGINEAPPVVKLSPASPRYGWIVGNLAAAQTRVQAVGCLLAQTVQQREQLYMLERGEQPKPTPAKAARRNPRAR